MAGSQMSYGDAQRGFRHVGEYAGRFLKGDKPDDLQQSTIAELVIFGVLLGRGFARRADG
jgi:hypothetical protein